MRRRVEEKKWRGGQEEMKSRGDVERRRGEEAEKCRGGE